MERISVIGRGVCFLILAMLLSGCTSHQALNFAQHPPFLEGANYQLIIEDTEMEDVLERYQIYFEEILYQKEHDEGITISFRNNGILYHCTIVPDDLSAEGRWAVFFVRP